MTTHRENGYLVERDADGSIVYAILLSEISAITRGDTASTTWRLPRTHTAVHSKAGDGHTFKCEIERIWTLINEKEET